MDIEQLNRYFEGEPLPCGAALAATALSALQAENESLKEKLYDGEGVNLVDYWMQQAKIEENGHRNCQAENEKLRAELEQVREKNAGLALALLTECAPNPDCLGDDEWRTIKAELGRVKRERDAAQVTLAETSGLAGGVVQTLFGVPLERMRELAKAELEGRILLRSAGAGKKCGSCGHFHRIPGTKRGTCDIRRWERNRLGQTEPWRHSFTPSQSYGACRDYIPREDDNHG